MTRIKTSALVGAVALALVLAGCGGSSSQRAEAPPPAPAPAPAPAPKTALESAKDALLTAQEMVPVITADSNLAALEAHHEAQTEVVEAADALLVLLQSDPTTLLTDGDEARAAKLAATNAMGPVALRITALTEAATARQLTITNAETAFTVAQAAVKAMKAISATSTVVELKAHNAAQAAVKGAADALVAALEAEPTSEAADITAAEEAATTAGEAAMAAMVRIVTADSVARAMAIMVNATDNATKAGVATAPFHSTKTEKGDNYAVAVARKSAADATVTVTDRNGSVMYTDDDEKLGAGDAPPAIKGWHGAGFKRDSENVFVYTDIAAPTPIPFFKVEDNGGKYTASVNSDDDTATGIGEGGLDALTIVQGYLTLWKSPALGSNPDKNVVTTTEYKDDKNTATDEAAFRGTFDGAPGLFKCSSNTCVLTTNYKRAVTSATGTWLFTPDVGETVDKPDTDHLHFGYWLQTTPKDDGTSSYAFQAFSGDAMLFVGADGKTAMKAVKGSAKYTGAAGGMYVKKVLKSDGMLDTATNGMFTAATILTANFGGGEVPADDHFSISGMVDKFMDGNTDLGWTVKLMRADFAKRNSEKKTEKHANKFNGMTEGSAGMDNGQWRGTFHGPSPKVEGDAPQMQPSGVAGQFNAHFTNGHVHGGFGATRTP